MNLKTSFGVAALLAMSASITEVFADDKPGIDRPIRVGMFKGTGTGGSYWHTNIHTSHNVLQGILANPATANLGDALEIPPAGFTFYSMPISLNNAGTAECTGGGCGATQQQIADFVSALDTLDVMIMSSVVNFGSRVTNAGHRQVIANFWTTKGYVAIHAITDSHGNWGPLDTIHGTQFRGHPAEQNGMVRVDSVFQDEPSWQFLNRGLFSGGALDTTFFEEWFFFTHSGAVIRSRPFLRPTTKLNEASLSNLGSQQPMGDHPHSWYRELPTGGRMFYTAVGHRAQVWNTTRMFRRQVYNGILWAAKYDEALADTVPEVSIQRNTVAPGPASEYSRVAITDGALTVTLLQPGAHTVMLTGVDGRRVGMRRGQGAESAHTFQNLRAGVYAVTVTTPEGRSNRLVTIH